MTPLLAWGAAAALIVLAAAAPGMALSTYAAVFAIAPAICVGLLGWPARAAELLPWLIAAGCLVALRRRDGHAPPRAFVVATIAVAVVVLASVVIQFSLTRFLMSPAEFQSQLRALTHSYVEGSVTFRYVIAAMPTLAGILLAISIAARSSDDAFLTRLLKMLLLGASALALLNVARMAGAVLRTGTPWAALPGAVTHLRISAPYGDPNATGSFFALVLPLAVAAARDAAGRRRIAYAAVSVLLAFVLWMTGSRAALVATGLVGAVALLRSGLLKSRHGRTAAVGAALLLGFALWLSPNSLFDVSSSTGALSIRAEMARVAVRLWRTDPSLGIGVGRFAERSQDEIRDPYVLEQYARGENAHNNFLQILAELGLIGAAAFALVLFFALRLPSGHGLRAGILSFLITCLAGHPLLVPDVSFAFWIVLGAAAGAQSARPSGRAGTGLAAALMTAALFCAPVSYRVERNRMPLDHVGFGVSEWLTDNDGRRYRRSEGDATVYVPSAARQLVLWLRPADENSGVLAVHIWLNGRPANTLQVSGAQWRRYQFVMPPIDGPAYVPLRFSAMDASGRPTPFLLAKLESTP